MNNRIRELRKERKLTMKQLGERRGLAERTFSQYETGKRELDHKTLVKISEFFHVSVDYLLGHVSEPWFYLDTERILREINSYDEEMPQDASKQHLLTAFDQLNEEGQTKAVERVEELTEIPKYQKKPPQD